MVILVDEWLGLQDDAGNLIEADLHHPHFDGLTLHIDSGASAAGAVPLGPVRPSPLIPFMSAYRLASSAARVADEATPMTWGSAPEPQAS